jgi:hypothetical protein
MVTVGAYFAWISEWRIESQEEPTSHTLWIADTNGMRVTAPLSRRGLNNLDVFWSPLNDTLYAEWREDLSNDVMSITFINVQPGTANTQDNTYSGGSPVWLIHGSGIVGSIREC